LPVREQAYSAVYKFLQLPFYLLVWNSLAPSRKPQKCSKGNWMLYYKKLRSTQWQRCTRDCDVTLLSSFPLPRYSLSCVFWMKLLGRRFRLW
jgi:hypothetical protein